MGDMLVAVNISCLGSVRATPRKLMEIISTGTRLGGCAAYLNSNESRSTLEDGHSIIPPV